MNSAVKLLGVGFLVLQFIVGCAGDKADFKNPIVDAMARAAEKQAYIDEMKKSFPCFEKYDNIWNAWFAYMDSFDTVTHAPTPETPVAKSNLQNRIRYFFNDREQKCCEGFYDFVMQKLAELKSANNGVYVLSPIFLPKSLNDTETEIDELLYTSIKGMIQIISMVSVDAFGDLQTFYNEIGDCANKMGALLEEASKFKMQRLDPLMRRFINDPAF